MINDCETLGEREEKVYMSFIDMDKYIRECISQMTQCCNANDKVPTDPQQCRYIHNFNYNRIVDEIKRYQDNCKENSYEEIISKIIIEICSTGTLNKVSFFLLYSLLYPPEILCTSQPIIIKSVGSFCRNKQIWQKIGPYDQDDKDIKIMQDYSLVRMLNKLANILVKYLSEYTKDDNYQVGNDIPVLDIFMTIKEILTLVDEEKNPSYFQKVYSIYKLLLILDHKNDLTNASVYILIIIILPHDKV